MLNSHTLWIQAQLISIDIGLYKEVLCVGINKMQILPNLLPLNILDMDMLHD